VLSANGGVAKSGRSSGLTCSNLSSVNTSVSVDYDKSCGGTHAFTVIFTNQVVISGADFSVSGDSGSLVVSSNNARPLGLLYAGSTTGTVANPISDVLDHSQVVGNEQIGQTELGLEIKQNVEDLRLNRNIQSRHSFVGHNEFSIHCQGSGDADALTLTAREFVWVTFIVFRSQTNTIHEVLDLHL
jgi:hypothetical protein